MVITLATSTLFHRIRKATPTSLKDVRHGTRRPDIERFVIVYLGCSGTSEESSVSGEKNAIDFRAPLFA